MYILKYWVLLYALWSGDARSAPEDFVDDTTRLLSHIRLSSEATASIPGVIDDIVQALQLRYPGCKAVLYGSVDTGLGITQSDLDVSISLLPEAPAANLTDIEFLYETADILLQYPQTFEQIKVYPMTRVPVVTITHVRTQFVIDISLGFHHGLHVSKLVRYLISLDQRAQDLALILKYWAQVHGFVSHTMLPSHAIVNMAIFYLQQKQILPPIAPLQTKVDINIVDGWNVAFSEKQYKSDNQESLCALLGGFFRYYANFDFETFMVAPFVGYPVKIDLFRDWETVPEEFELYRVKVGQNITKPLKIEHPIVLEMLEHNNNVAHRVVDPARWRAVRGAIRYAADMYQEGCTGYFERIVGYI